MPSAMNDAFWKAIVDYVKDPSKLDSILTNLDTVQADAYGDAVTMAAAAGAAAGRPRRHSSPDGGSAMDPRLVDGAHRAWSASRRCSSATSC